MKLYGPTYSPFVARVRIALRAKSLSYQPTPIPEGGLKSPEFLAINPFGRVPVLVLDDGRAISESETILYYLEETYPNPPLLPTDPYARAQVRTIIRATENYLTPPTTRLFPLRFTLPRDDQTIAHEVEPVIAALKLLDHLISPTPFTIPLTLADAVLFSSLYLIELIMAQLDIHDYFAETPTLKTYFEAGKTHPLLSVIYQENRAALLNRAPPSKTPPTQTPPTQTPPRQK